MQLDTTKPQIVSLDGMDSDAIRTHVVQITRDFKNSWRNLAQALQAVFKDKLYREWGYSSFDNYVAKEVHVRKHTAMKLIRSYEFLQKEEPLYLEESSQDGQPINKGLSFEEACILQRAKKALPDDDYHKVKDDITKTSRDASEVKKDLTSLIMKRRKDIDPEKDRTRQNKAAINRFLGVLRSFKQDVDLLAILPGSISNEIDKLVKNIEKCGL